VGPRAVTAAPGLRFVFLDPYEEAVIGVERGGAGYAAAASVLRANNPNDFETSTDWLRGLQGLRRRFVPYNGQVGPGQLAWLREELRAAACERGEVCLVFSHVPLCPGACSSSCLAWNFDAVLGVLGEFASAKFAGRAGVGCVFAGHDHKGGLAVDAAGIHHVTLAAPLESPDGLAHAVCKCLPGGLELLGKGAVPRLSLAWCASPAQAAEWREDFASKEVQALFELCKGAKDLAACRHVWEAHGGAWDALPEGWPKRYDD
jgi:hypothetical protein